MFSKQDLIYLIYNINKNLTLKILTFVTNCFLSVAVPLAQSSSGQSTPNATARNISIDNFAVSLY